MTYPASDPLIRALACIWALEKKRWLSRAEKTVLVAAHAAARQMVDQAVKDEEARERVRKMIAEEDGA